MTGDSMVYECRSKKCERATGHACIIIMPDTSIHSLFIGKLCDFYDKYKKSSIICPFLEVMDCDNSEWEQITRVTITRKY